jgi:hypothetical protein
MTEDTKPALPQQNENIQEGIVRPNFIPPDLQRGMVAPRIIPAEGQKGMVPPALVHPVTQVTPPPAPAPTPASAAVPINNTPPQHAQSSHQDTNKGK